jgi:hypothetical protein
VLASFCAEAGTPFILVPSPLGRMQYHSPLIIETTNCWQPSTCQEFHQLILVTALWDGHHYYPYFIGDQNRMFEKTDNLI